MSLELAFLLKGINFCRKKVHGVLHWIKGKISFKYKMCQNYLKETVKELMTGTCIYMNIIIKVTIKSCI